MNLRVCDADITLRLFISIFLIVLTIGYGIGLFFVKHQTSYSPTGVEEQFLGNENSETTTEMRYSKSANEMFIFMHNHILSTALLFFAVGGIFYFSSIVSDRMKRILMIEPLIALVTTFGGIGLVRYVSPYFSWLVIVSGVSVFLCYSVMVFFVMKELWRNTPSPVQRGKDSADDV